MSKTEVQEELDFNFAASAETPETRTKKQAQLELNTFLTEIRRSDMQQVEAQLNIARILGGIYAYKLFLPVYNKFDDMARDQLDFPLSHANSYRKMYTQYTELKYSRAEFLKLMKQFGWRRVHKALQGATKKMGSRAMQMQLLKMEDSERYRQYHLEMKSDEEARIMNEALLDFGMEYDENRNRFFGVSGACLAMAKDHVNKKRAASKRKTGKSKLQAA